MYNGYTELDCTRKECTIILYVLLLLFCTKYFTPISRYRLLNIVHNCYLGSIFDNKAMISENRNFVQKCPRIERRQTYYNLPWIRNFTYDWRIKKESKTIPALNEGIKISLHQTLTESFEFGNAINPTLSLFKNNTKLKSLFNRKERFKI